MSRLKVVKSLPIWLGYGPNGKKILTKVRKKFDPEQYNPYQATKLPTIKQLSRLGMWDQVWDQVEAQVGSQVEAQVEDQMWDQVGYRVRSQVWDQVEDQVWDQVEDQVWDQVRNQVWDQVEDQVGYQVGYQVRSQVRSQVGYQVRATSYWAINIRYNLGVSHWFGEFLKLGVVAVFVNGKVKIFGKKGKYLGEYDQEEFFKKKVTIP